MRIGIIDADLIGRNKHRFPNLACMKISSYHKSKGDNVQLLFNYDDVSKYDKVYISKVFTETEIPCEPKDKTNKNVDNISEWYKDNEFLLQANIEYGGTGFFYNEAPPLKPEIEHSMPDYHLYDDFINEQITKGAKPKSFQYFTDASIGFTTRGCIRGCSFCVNKDFKQCFLHSPVSEFLDESRKYIVLLDDNVLSCKDWKKIFAELNATGKPFQYRQGMDERLLTDEKCEIIFNSNWFGDYLFAFDNIKDRRIVEKKLKLIREHTDKIPKFYCFCGYNHKSPKKYPSEFWVKDIEDLFERIKILMSYDALPYVMRHANYNKSPYKTLYNSIAAWCNQPGFFKKTSFREFCERSHELNRKSLLRALKQFESAYPEIAEKYFDMKWK